MGKLGATVLTFIAVGLVAACGAGAWKVTHAFDPVDGHSVAKDEAAQDAERLNARLGYRNRPRDAEWIAATEVNPDPKAAPTTDGTEVAAIAWSGRVYSNETATIDVRFTVTETAQDPISVGSRGQTAGRATRCYRYALQYYRDTGYREIRCPTITNPPVPSASPVLQLPGDAASLLAAALRTATPETVTNAVRAAFPQPGITIDTVTADGTLVAAVGVPAERDCIVMIRTPDRATKQVSFDQIQLEPGETGCRAALYTHPVHGH